MAPEQCMPPVLPPIHLGSDRCIQNSQGRDDCILGLQNLLYMQKVEFHLVTQSCLSVFLFGITYAEWSAWINLLNPLWSTTENGWKSGAIILASSPSICFCLAGLIDFCKKCLIELWAAPWGGGGHSFSKVYFIFLPFQSTCVVAPVFFLSSHSSPSLPSIIFCVLSVCNLQPSPLCSAQTQRQRHTFRLIKCGLKRESERGGDRGQESV